MALTNKQQIFVDEYLKCWNATESAKAAGYSERTAANIGWENVRKPEIAEAIRARVSASAMSADEVLMRLADMARSSIGDFIDPDTHTIDMKKAQQAGKMHLLKKFKYTTVTRTISEDEAVQTDTIEIEPYDAQAALVQLGRYHKLFVDRVQQDDWRTQAIDLIKRGELVYDALADEVGRDLATELFTTAGVPVAST